MKQLLSLIALLGLLVFSSNTTTVIAQCNELFISEYIEGNFNNKGLEIYNPTDQVINLSGYQIIRWSNGNAVYDPSGLYAWQLSGEIQPKDVHVLSLDKQDCTLTGVDTCVFTGLSEKADAFASPIYDLNRTLYHNGNDAISLNRIDQSNPASPGAFVDIFGLVGEDPDNASTGYVEGWTDEFPYIGTGSWWTRDQTLVRKPSVTGGVTANPGAPYTASFNPTAEWDSLPSNTFSHLQYHECECGNNVGIDEPARIAKKVAMYPNPAKDRLTIASQWMVNSIEIYTATGQLVKTQAVNDFYSNIDVSLLAQGSYWMKTNFDEGVAGFQQLVIAQ